MDIPFESTFINPSNKRVEIQLPGFGTYVIPWHLAKFLILGHRDKQSNLSKLPFDLIKVIGLYCRQLQSVVKFNIFFDKCKKALLKRNSDIKHIGIKNQKLRGDIYTTIGYRDTYFNKDVTVAKIKVETGFIFSKAGVVSLGKIHGMNIDGIVETLMKNVPFGSKQIREALEKNKNLIQNKRKSPENQSDNKIHSVATKKIKSECSMNKSVILINEDEIPDLV